MFTTSDDAPFLPSPTALASISTPPTYELIPHRVFVGGFPPSTTELELRSHFERFFHIREAKVIRNIEGISRGYGFVTFDSEEEAEAVRSMSPALLEFKGRRLNVGPALRRMSPVMYPQTEYAVATPSGIVSPTFFPQTQFFPTLPGPAVMPNMAFRYTPQCAPQYFSQCFVPSAPITPMMCHPSEETPTWDPTSPPMQQFPDGSNNP